MAKIVENGAPVKTEENVNLKLAFVNVLLVFLVENAKMVRLAYFTKANLIF